MSTIKEEFEAKDGENFPGKIFSETLLKPIFDDQKEHLFDAMFRVHTSHTTMLAEQGILTENEAVKILAGVKQVEEKDRTKIHYDSEYEDLFYLVESQIGDVIGHELAGKMHIAKSRNDMGEAMYRIVLRGYIKDSISYAENLAVALLQQAEDHIHSIMPAHTHTQQAKPKTFGNYLVELNDNLVRDLIHMSQAYRTVNQSPMGAAAITTSGFPISR